jgi:hypothetical protein
MLCNHIHNKKTSSPWAIFLSLASQKGREREREREREEEEEEECS